jgi:hypothetical protein
MSAEWMKYVNPERIFLSTIPKQLNPACDAFDAGFKKGQITLLKWLITDRMAGDITILELQSMLKQRQGK